MFLRLLHVTVKEAKWPALNFKIDIFFYHKLFIGKENKSNIFKFEI